MALDYNLIGQMFNQTTIAGASWVVGLILTFLTVMLISRDMEDWPILILPVMIGLRISGVTMSYLWLMIAALVFVLKSIGIRGIGNVAFVSSEYVREKTTGLFGDKLFKSSKIYTGREQFRPSTGRVQEKIIKLPGFLAGDRTWERKPKEDEVHKHKNIKIDKIINMGDR